MNTSYSTSITHGLTQKECEHWETIASALAVVARAATASVAGYLRAVARTVSTFDTKADLHDPVTEHDSLVERALHELLGRMVPGSRVLGEEIGDITLPAAYPPLSSEFLAHFPMHTSPQIENARNKVSDLGGQVRWIVDPIDGTANFAAGLDYFNTSIGVEFQGKIIAGVVSVPMRHEFFIADLAHCWYENPKETIDLHADGPTSENKALLVCYYPSLAFLNKHPQIAFKHEKQLTEAFHVNRRFGAMALDLAQVAAGWIGCVIATQAKPWDVAAGIHLIRIAGGEVLNLPIEENLPDGLRPILVASSHGLDAHTAQEVIEDTQKIIIKDLKNKSITSPCSYVFHEE